MGDARGATVNANDSSFFLKLALAMAIILVAGFSMQLAMGRSSFAAPALVHAHAMVFFGWVMLFVTQTWLAARGPQALHRRLGRLGGVWMLAMIPLGFAATINAVQQVRVTFFFLPQHFLIADPATILCFAGLTIAAIMLRRRTDWHWRLHVGAMAALLGPGFGRLLPMPFIGPFAFEIAAGLGLLFPIFGMIRDKRTMGHVHPAWWWGSGAIVGVLAAAWLIAHSSVGASLYGAAVAGTPAETIPGLAYGAPPGPPPSTPPMP